LTAMTANTIQRALPNTPASILFRRNFRHHVTGSLKPGAHLLVFYDAERMTQERSFEGDKPAWGITMHARFVPGGNVLSMALWSRTGIILTGVKTSDDPGEGTMLKCDFEIPGNAQFVEMWFTNSGRSGATYFDSDFGKNYLFRFTARDISPPAAVVLFDRAAGQSEFQMELSAAPEIGAVAADYWVVNVTPPLHAEAALVPDAQPAASGRRTWHTQGLRFPYKAVIAFDLRYTVNGREAVDDNSQRHFLAGESEK
jgi:hypothetical protein